MRKRDNSIVQNVDFTRLSEILRKKHIKWSKLSRKCGYDDSGYAEKNASNNDTAKTTDSDDTYNFIVSINGEFLKRLAMASLNEHTSIENFIFDCIWKSVN